MGDATKGHGDSGGGEAAWFEVGALRRTPRGPAPSACLALALLPAALHAWVRMLGYGVIETSLALFLGGPVVLMVLVVLARAFRVAPRTLRVPLMLAGFLSWPWLACVWSGLQGLVDPAIVRPHVHGPATADTRPLTPRTEGSPGRRTTERLGLVLERDLRLLRIHEFRPGEGDTEHLLVVEVSDAGADRTVSSVQTRRSCHDCGPSPFPLIQSLPIRPNIGDTFFVEFPGSGSRQLAGAPPARTVWTSGLVQVRPDGSMEVRSPLLAALPLLALFLGPLLIAASPIQDQRAKAVLSLLWILTWYTAFYGPAFM